MLHIYPVGDEKEHDIESTTCWCEPKIEWDHPEPLVIHNAADCREIVEEAERIKEKGRMWIYFTNDEARIS